MSEHLTFEEMRCLLDISEINDDSKHLAQKVARHTNECRECYEDYSALLELDNRLEELRLSELRTLTPSESADNQLQF